MPVINGRTLGRDALLQRVLAQRLVAIVRLKDADALLDAAAAVIEGGIGALEFTLTTPGALGAVEEARARFPDVVVGAGTVLDAEDARRSIETGAQFLVSPGFDSAVIEAARQHDIVAMPGAMTPTEILTAWEAGADIVKVFPARSLGPTFIADVLAPLPDVPLMPTGGVDAGNAAAYLEAGAVAVAVGGSLIGDRVVARRDWADLTRRARELVAVCR